MIWWFFGALSLSLVVAFIGLKKSTLPKRRNKPGEIDLYYEQIRKDCLTYAEQLYK